MGESRPVRATAAEVCRNFGLWQDRAMTAPVLVTNHGRPKAVLLSVEAWQGGEGGIDSARTAPPTMEAAVLDRIEQCHLLLDDRMTVVAANRAASRHFRLTPDDLRGRMIGDLFTDLAAAVLERILMRVLVTGEPRCFEAPGNGGDGMTLGMDAARAGESVSLLFRVADADLETRARLAEAEALDMLMAVHGGAGTARLSVRGTFSSVGEPLAAMLGFARTALCGARLVDIVPPKCRVGVRDAIERVLAASEGVSVDTRLLGRGTGEFPVTMAIVPTRTAYAVDGAALLVTPRPEA